MTPSDLAACGVYLHGSGWQQPLARDLGVERRTIQRWIKGEFKIPHGAADDLVILTACRWIENNFKSAALLGSLGSGRLLIPHVNTGWSAGLDERIKETARLILEGEGVSVITL